MSPLPETRVTYSRIQCCIECGVAYLPKAQYALRTLLRPIRLEPEWVTRDALSDVGIFYGADVQGIGAGTLVVPLETSTESYFANRSTMPHLPSGISADGLLRLFPFQAPASNDAVSVNQLSWDPIASAFFFLSGWQEWVDETRDVHGRFPYERSILARYDLADNPMVDRYRRYLRGGLEALGLSISRRLWNGRESAVCITHDIDYHRKWRPGILVGETMKNVVRSSPAGRLNGLARLVRSLGTSMAKGDPFRQSANEMIAAETVAGFGATWFFKAAAHGSFDVNYSIERGWIRRIIDHLEISGFEIGLHTSYFASDHPGYVEDERRRLQGVLTGALQSVRSHYLRWFVSTTSQIYADAGFFIDSSLGFAEREGFRNGTTAPFRIFDIPANQPLNIWEMPLAIMDTTLYGYRDLDLQAGIETTRRLMEVTKEFGGVLVILWHNIMLDTLGNGRIAPHFTGILENLDPRTVYVASLRDALSVWLDQTAATTQGDE